MTALFVNLKIDKPEKFEFFKVTLLDIEHLFRECHIKIRGKYSAECIKFAEELFLNRANFYQELQESDWVAASLIMIENVKSSSIFFYLEDHKLTISSNKLSLALKEFDKNKLDYLCYSFFRASRLDIKNLLPLNPVHGQEISQFLLDKDNAKLISKISPFYYTFSLASVSSTNFFKKLLLNENKKFKIHFKKVSSLLSIIFSYPKYKIVINFINFFLSFLNSRLCFFPPDTPFNMEKLNIEMNISKEKWKFGILQNELFANFDDDNNAYGESLIKRGLYPLDLEKEVSTKIKNCINFSLKINKDSSYDLSYYSQIQRISSIPCVFIKVKYGKITVNYNNKVIILEKNDYQGFYTNLSPIINCTEDAEIVITVHDECFA
jgi:hypothetical protein